MFRFSIRDTLWLVAVIAVASCWFVEHRSATRQSQEAAADAQGRERDLRDQIGAYRNESTALKASLNQLSLYADTDAERLTSKFSVKSEYVKGEYIVVPIGQSWPRREVFEVLGIDSTRLVDFRHRGANNDFTMAWQFSPNYDLVCITGTNYGTGQSLPLDHPNRRIYGVHFYKRTGDRRYFQ